MSIGLAIKNISMYTSMIGSLTEKVDSLEKQAISAASSKDDPALKSINTKLAIYKTLLGMVKDFLEFWKETIKSVLGLFKLFGDLAKGAQ